MWKHMQAHKYTNVSYLVAGMELNKAFAADKGERQLRTNAIFYNHWLPFLCLMLVMVLAGSTVSH